MQGDKTLPHDQIPEKLIPLAKLSTEVELRGGNRVSRSTIYRWVHRGIKGRKLRTVMIGGTEYTTWKWLLNMTPTEDTGPPGKEPTCPSAEQAAQLLIDEGL